MNSVSLAQVLKSGNGDEIISYLAAHLHECGNVPEELFMSVLSQACSSQTKSHREVKIALLSSRAEPLPMKELRRIIREVPSPLPGSHPNLCDKSLNASKPKD